MPLQYDPVLVRCLARELGEWTTGRRARELRLHRGMRAAELRLEEGPSLLFLLHPEAGFLLEADPGALEAMVLAGRGPSGADPRAALSEVTAVDLHGSRLTGAWSPPDERLLVLELEGGGRRGRLVAELLTNQWNLLLVEKTGAPPPGAPKAAGRAAVDGADESGRWRIRAALWPREAGGRDLRGARPYRPPSFPGGPRRWRDSAPSREAWRSLLADSEPGRRAGVLLREAAWTSGLTAVWILGEAAGVTSGDARDAAGSGHDATRGEADAAGRDMEAARERYLTLLGLAAVPGAPAPRGHPAAWLLPGEAGAQPYPGRLGRPDAVPVDSLLAAFGRAAAGGRWAPPAAAGPGPAAEGAGTGGRTEGARPAGEEVPPTTDPEALRLEAALLAAAERTERRAAALEREMEEGPAADRLRDDANLILARLRDIPRGADRVTLEGFGGEPREIELDPALSAAENADRLYGLAARRQRAAERLPLVLARVRARLEALRAGLRTLAESAPSEALWKLAGGRPGEERGAAAGDDEARLPYRRYLSSGGLEIRVGRGARQNDELTFHHSHGEDIWLHARQVPGAHVILRWGRRDANPPRRDLLEAAVAAAVHSEARHSGTVGVDWTRRKYVRSPRKAPPGLVVPERVQTVFVEPSEALLERLKPTR